MRKIFRMSPVMIVALRKFALRFSGLEPTQQDAIFEHIC